MKLGLIQTLPLLDPESEDKRLEQCEVLLIEYRFRKSDKILSKQKRRFMFYVPFKTVGVYERIPLFLLSRTIILKIVQTLENIRYDIIIYQKAS